MSALPDRFWTKVEKTADCWEWRGYLCVEGYGQFRLNGRILRAHRVAYEAEVAPIPQGLVIDHLCRNRACVRPDHLEPVTDRENILRSPISLAVLNAVKTHCPRGHAYTPENIRRSQKRPRARWCLACERSRIRTRAAVAQPVSA